MLRKQLLNVGLNGIPTIPVNEVPVFTKLLDNRTDSCLVIPISNKLIPTIKNQILKNGGIRRRIQTVLIEFQNSGILVADDNFCHDCTWVEKSVEERFLQDLLIKRIIQYYIVFTGYGEGKIFEKYLSKADKIAIKRGYLTDLTGRDE